MKRELSEHYDFRKIEQKWQKRWSDAKLFQVEYDPSKPKFYGLEFFPYPSGEGLSVGHFKNYAPNDAFLRYKSMRGYNVLHPMGWDAFGQPAENEAIKRKRNPREMVPEYAANYKRQFNLIGLSYDWDREVNSSNPDYYKWTQWIFLKLFEMGLAYRKEAPVNWCPNCKTVLANEEVVNGRCWRCKSVVEKRMMPQWFFKITAYAERLLSDLELINWSEGIKAMQRNWIGKSVGAEVDFQIAPPAPNNEGAGTSPQPSPSQGEGEKITVFTTRPDTLWGATFMVLAPEHPLVARITTAEYKPAVERYVAKAARESDIERQAEGKEKTGVWTGAYAVNPVNNERIPIWIADYVLMGYGTGAIMAVPAHDERDFEFAKKFGLPIVQVIDGGVPVSDEAYVGDGKMINSGPLIGTPGGKAASEVVARWLEEKGLGKPSITYRLRDWLISRQRYWGAPIPIVHCPTHGEVAVPLDKLPVLLPDVDSYQPSETGESPLATIPGFVNTTCPVCGGPARRETDTMGGFACSSWYFLRFADPHNDKEPFSREKVDYWMPVDVYVGGAEHAVMHLLYARFWTKALHDAGLLGFVEPFTTLRNQGMMLAYTAGRKIEPNEAQEEAEGEPIEDWKVLTPEERETFPLDQIVWRWVKMSKSLKNVVTPDETAESYGADALRTFEMFMVPFEDTVQWSEEGIRGSARFLARVYRLVAKYAPSFRKNWRDELRSLLIAGAGADLRRKTHQTILKVTDDLETFRFNTAVASLMELTNMMYGYSELMSTTTDREALIALDEAVETLVLLLSPIAPHLADELWEGLGQEGFLYKHPWPEADQAIAKAEEITLIVQVNGKLRDKLTTPADSDKTSLEALALASPKVQELLNGGAPKKVIVVPGRLVNIVI